MIDINNLTSPSQYLSTSARQHINSSMNHSTRLNQYRIMWIVVLFDLLTNTKKERKAATGFRQKLIKDGSNMFQFSVYMRHCPSRENAEVHIKRAKDNLPPYGKVAFLMFTDRQFGMMQVYHATKKTDTPRGPQQLEMF